VVYNSGFGGQSVGRVDGGSKYNAGAALLLLLLD